MSTDTTTDDGTDRTSDPTAGLKDTDPDRAGNPDALTQRLGKAAGRVARLPIVIPKQIGLGFLHGIGRTRMGPRPWHKKLKRDFRRLRKARDADIVGLVATSSGGFRAEPMKLKRNPEEAGEMPHWAGLWSDDKYRAVGEGVRYSFDGEPIALFYEGVPREATMVEPAAAEALQLGKGQPLYQLTDSPEVQVTERYEFGPEAAQAMMDGEDPGAAADGGRATLQNQSYTVPNGRAALEDYIVDLPTASGGAQVALDKIRDIQLEAVGSEEIAKAEERGRAQEREDDEGNDAVKIMMYAAIIVLIVVVGFMVVSGQGGIGGVVPTMLGVPG